MADLLEQLQPALGDGAVRPGGDDDGIDGVLPAVVAAPRTVEEIGACLRTAAEAGAAVCVRSGGSKLGWGAPPHRLDLLLDVSAMARVLEHAAGDLVARVEPGVRLATLQEELAPAGQRLALDPPEARATLGGVVSTAASGPARHLYGTPRDLVIGMTVVLADGTVAKSGGKVVKNVAGYDLAKLFTGAIGTLGVVAEVIVRLHPLPATRRWVSAPVGSPSHARQRVAAVLDAQFGAAAVELDWAGDSGHVQVLVEGIEAGVDSRVRAAVDALGGQADVTAEPPAGWGERPWADGEVGVKVSAEIGALEQVLAALPGDARLRGHAGVGVYYAALPTDAAARIDAARSALAAHDGSVVVLDAPAALKADLDVWGPVRGLDLMRRLKDRFDPDHRLAPGRFVGGI